MRLRILLASILAGAIFAPAAAAVPPEHIPLPLDEPFLIEDVCGFPVLFEEVVDRSTLKIFSDGRAIVTGPEGQADQPR